MSLRSQNRLIYDELNYNREMLAAQHSEYMSKLNNEQREVYDKIMSSIENLQGNFFFLYGYDGTGKTFLWRTLSIALHSKGEIVLTIASNGIASLLLPGGLTAHSRFAIPININEDSTCNIKQVVDRTLRDILRFTNADNLNKPFGGTNMRIELGNLECEVEKASEFSEWILRVGDGRIGEPNNGEVCIEIPIEFLINGSNDPIGSLVDNTYPSYLENMSIDGYLQHRAILAPTNEIVERINDYKLALVPGEMKTFLSFDSPCTMGGDVDRIDDIHTPKFLNTITSSRLPKQELKLKVGVPVMLLRNIDQSTGLCNGIRLLITQLGNHVLEGKIISITNSGQKVFIPRLSLTPSDKTLPLRFQFRQFPVALSFAMTINKSQGQSFQHVDFGFKGAGARSSLFPCFFPMKIWKCNRSIETPMDGPWANFIHRYPVKLNQEDSEDKGKGKDEEKVDLWLAEEECKKKKEQARYEIAANPELDLLQGELEEELKKEQFLEEELR
ncbi:ATP-dependent DNA helicase PIF1-like [Senna tora]|uniref:ATP-dependent DNA helicase n=1 Tax=Senna tora TaxID=362788 RepID=A0A834X0E2_9FABA|nr:ATP-dependent DNA helicase PIF1-like [Senna tora]